MYLHSYWSRQKSKFSKNLTPHFMRSMNVPQNLYIKLFKCDRSNCKLDGEIKQPHCLVVRVDEHRGQRLVSIPTIPRKVTAKNIRAERRRERSGQRSHTKYAKVKNPIMRFTRGESSPCFNQFFAGGCPTHAICFLCTNEFHLWKMHGLWLNKS
jgi:hypothetical protein